MSTSADRLRPLGETFRMVPVGAAGLLFSAFLTVAFFSATLSPPPVGYPISGSLQIFCRIATLCGALGFFLIGWSGGHTLFALTPEGLSIRSPGSRRFIPREDLLVGEACAVSLRDNPQLKPRSKGIAPGYHRGRGHLRNGDRALFFLTDRRQVGVLPTNRNYLILLSVADPERFLAVAQVVWSDPVPPDRVPPVWVPADLSVAPLAPPQ